MAASACEEGWGFGYDLLDYSHYTPVWSPDGTWIVFQHYKSLYTVSSDGSGLKRIGSGKGDYDYDADLSPDISPNGSRIVYSTYKDPWILSSELPHWEIETVDLDGSSRQTLAKNEAYDVSPAWSPDGSRIAFVSDRAEYGGVHIYTMTADGSDVQIVAPSVPFATAAVGPPAWSPNGERFAFVGMGHATEKWRHAAYTVGADGSGLAMLGETRTPPAWSPDGRRIAFMGTLDGSWADGSWAIYTAAADGTDLAKVVDIGGRGPRYNEPGERLSWSPDSSKFLLSRDSSIIVVNADGSDLEGREGGYASWSPDGSRIAVKPWFGIGRMSKPKPGAIALYTTKSDGSDMQVLARQGNRGLVAELEWRGNEKKRAETPDPCSRMMIREKRNSPACR